MNPPIKFAVIGHGKIGQRHAELIREHPDARLVAVVDVNQEVETQVGKDTPFFNELEALWQSEITPDVVNICTPNGLHAPQSMEALDNGCHVVCEKPMGLQKDKCEEVISKALQNARQVFCVMQNRYSPPSRWLKEMIEQERLGKIQMVHFNCFWNRNEQYYAQSDWKGTLEMDGGPLFTQFSHFVDLLYWLFGDIEDIDARFANYQHRHNTEFEDSGLVRFGLKQGGMGTFHYTTAAYQGNVESSVTIMGEKAVIKVGGQYMEDVEICRVQNYEMPDLPPTNPPNVYDGYTGSAANHGHVIQNVIDTLTSDGEITTNALEGLKVVDMIERMYEQRRTMTNEKVK